MSECSHDVEGNICSRAPMLNTIKRFCKEKAGIQPLNNPREIISTASKILNVNTELQVLSHPSFKDFAGRSVEVEKRERFLPKGPKNTTDLLDNFNIDENLQQLSRKFNVKTNHKYKFYHVPFQMIDFNKYGTELANLYIPELLENGFNCFGCVLNTDVSSGPGKHWFCIFGDMTGDGTELDPWYIEFFNSSGNYPTSEVHEWMHEKIAECARQKKRMEIHIEATVQIQNDRHSCGVYCLSYIYHRLHDKPRGWFLNSGIGDEHMLQFRKKFFREE